MSDPGAAQRPMFYIPDRRGSSQERNDFTPVDPSYKTKELHAPAISLTSPDLTKQEEHESRVLVLYTGGTIGMKLHDGVYSPEPDFLVDELKKLPMFHDPMYAMRFSSQVNEQPLVMPASSTDGKRVVYVIYEYSPLLDSANMTMDDWSRIARDIKKNYERFDAFLILHGTDTMAYTASALSFMMENLGKPVILTGSQIPIFETRSDGRDNLLGALIVAGHYCIPEVTIFFNNKLLRGNRSVKSDSGSFDAFTSPNLPPLVDMEVSIHVHWEAVFRSSAPEKFDIQRTLCPNVGILRLFPSITCATVQAFLQPPMQGVVIQTYGAGNGPNSRKDLLKVFKEASDRVLILNITQCSRGIVSTSYATGKALVEAGIVPGSDMTPEGALTKLAYVLAKPYSMEKKRKMLQTNLRGEMKVSIKSALSLLDFELISKVSEALHLSSSEELVQLRGALYPSLMCSAAKSGDIDTLEKLRQTGGDFALTDYDGRTPLHVAASEGYYHTTNYLLGYGASVHVKDRYGDTPLSNAVRFKRPEIIKKLRHVGAALTIVPTKLGIELCNAVANEDVELLKCYSLAGADLNQGDYDKRTALHLAVTGDHKEIVTFLLEKDCSIAVEDIHGKTPLCIAEQSHPHLVPLLKKQPDVANLPDITVTSTPNES